MKKILIFILTCFLTITSYSQNWDLIVSNSFLNRKDGSVITRNDSLYLIGGRNAQSVGTEIWDKQTNTWSEINTPDSMRIINHFQPQLYYNYIIIGGGIKNNTWNQWEPQDSIWFLDPSNQWYKSIEIPNEYQYGSRATCIYNDELYMFGGSRGNDSITTSQVVKVNLLTGQWTQLADMDSSRHGFQAQIWNDAIYLMGGQYKDGFITKYRSSIEKYDPGNNRWSTIGNMPQPLAKYQSIIVDNKFYITGGISGCYLCSNSSTNYYDLVSEQWIYGPDLILDRAGTGMDIINDTLYIVSGNTGGICDIFEYLPIGNTTLSFQEVDYIFNTEKKKPYIYFNQDTHWIKVNYESQITTRVIDLEGRVIYQGNSKNFYLNLSSGMYWVHSFNEQFDIRKKFIKN